jgi:hypothetical protein
MSHSTARETARDVAALPALGVKQLQERCAELFGEPTNCHNKAWLVKRIAWRMQVRSEGGLSDRARQRAAELADDTHLRLGPPKPSRDACPKPPPVILPIAGNNRLPPPGTVITRAYKGRSLAVEVLAEGFAYEGERFSSLSAVARHITGSHVNGYRFFGLGGVA